LEVGEIGAYRMPQCIYPKYAHLPVEIDSKHYNSFAEAIVFEDAGKVFNAQVAKYPFILRLKNTWHFHYDPIVMRGIRDLIIPILYDSRNIISDSAQTMSDDLKKKTDELKICHDVINRNNELVESLRIALAQKQQELMQQRTNVNEKKIDFPKPKLPVPAPRGIKTVETQTFRQCKDFVVQVAPTVMAMETQYLVEVNQKSCQYEPDNCNSFAQTNSIIFKSVGTEPEQPENPVENNKTNVVEKLTVSSEAQTDNNETPVNSCEKAVISSETQTNAYEKAVISSETQTDVHEKAVISSETQTDTYEKAAISSETQTDIHEKAAISSETHEKAVDSSETQTDAHEKPINNSETQTDKVDDIPCEKVIDEARIEQKMDGEAQTENDKKQCETQTEVEEVITVETKTISCEEKVPFKFKKANFPLLGI